jgi:hypothetical protein
MKALTFLQLLATEGPFEAVKGAREGTMLIRNFDGLIVCQTTLAAHCNDAERICRLLNFGHKSGAAAVADLLKLTESLIPHSHKRTHAQQLVIDAARRALTALEP